MVSSESERVCGSFRDAAAYQQCLSQLEREGSLVRLSLGINLAETDPSRRGRRLPTSRTSPGGPAPCEFSWAKAAAIGVAVLRIDRLLDDGQPRARIAARASSS